MAEMRQSRTDYGTRGESGERIPSKAKASDTSGDRRVSVPRADREGDTGSESGARAPAKAKGSDASGERKTGINGGVGMGMADGTGRESDHGKAEGKVGEWKGGTKGEGHAYKHNKSDYR